MRINITGLALLAELQRRSRRGSPGQDCAKVWSVAKPDEYKHSCHGKPLNGITDVFAGDDSLSAIQQPRRAGTRSRNLKWVNGATRQRGQGPLPIVPVRITP